MNSRPPRSTTPVPVRRRRFKPLPRVRPDELWLYRERTLALLHRYFRLSLEYGRLPSLLGREFFRTRVTSYHMVTFEDGVIFVHDMERCLERLRPALRQVIARVVFQDYTQEEAARLLGCTDRWVRQRLAQALDQLSDIFLRNGLLRPMTSLAQPSAGPKPLPARRTLVEISSSAEDRLPPPAGEAAAPDSIAAAAWPRAGLGRETCQAPYGAGIAATA
jgi:hypothetical protein